MANTLTGLIQTIYDARNVVSRERVGFIPAVTKNSTADYAALDQTIRVSIADAVTSEASNTPAVAPPDTGDVTASYVDMTISKSQHIPVRFTGEETQALKNSGVYDDFVSQRFKQAFRRLDNLIEADLASTYKYASRAVGTAGTTPFNTAGTVSDFANVMQILDDNGCPDDGTLRLVLSNAAVANLRGKQSTFYQVNTAGTDEMLREGKIAKAFGFNIGQSAQVARHTKGTLGGSPTLTSADYAAGATSLVLASAGTGTIVQGDMVNIAGENNGIWYGVDTGDSDVSDGGTIVLNKPGLTLAQTTNTSAVSLAANYSANMAFHPSAIQLLTRVPAMGNDLAVSKTMVYDDVSGITYEVAEYAGFGQTTFHVRLAWGWKAIKPAHIAVLFG
jgi:hypothetical protein